MSPSPLHSTAIRPYGNHEARPGPDTAYGIVCVGFGVTALSIAIALREVEADSPILFLERGLRDQWQRYSPIPFSYMQTSFLQDLTTQRNPLSKFTLTNYLHETGQLLTFLNHSRLTPSTAVIKGYLDWSASHFDDWVCYGKNVLAVEPIQDVSGVVGGWKVLIRDIKTTKIYSVRARKVILAIGAQPCIPTALSTPEVETHVVHCSRYMEFISDFPDHPPEALNVAIVGQNEEAAKIFKHIQSLHLNYRATLFISTSALRPKETNPL